MTVSAPFRVAGSVRSRGDSRGRQHRVREEREAGVDTVEQGRGDGGGGGDGEFDGRPAPARPREAGLLRALREQIVEPGLADRRVAGGAESPEAVQDDPAGRAGDERVRAEAHRREGVAHRERRPAVDPIGNVSRRDLGGDHRKEERRLREADDVQPVPLLDQVDGREGEVEPVRGRGLVQVIGPERARASVHRVKRRAGAHHVSLKTVFVGNSA